MTSILKVSEIQDPTNSNTALTIDAAGKVTAPNLVMPAGSVVQVVTGTDSANNSTSSTSFVNTNLAATITPTSASSTIFVIATGGVDNSAGGGNGYVTIARNGTNLGNGTGGTSYFYSPYRLQIPWSASVLDSPASTSALTYTVQLRSGGGATVEFPGTSAKKSITLIEIAG